MCGVAPDERGTHEQTVAIVHAKPSRRIILRVVMSSNFVFLNNYHISAQGNSSTLTSGLHRTVSAEDDTNRWFRFSTASTKIGVHSITSP